MGRRVGQLAGLFAFLLMMGRLGRLLQTGPRQAEWQLILVASAFLGAVAWWLLGQATANRRLRIGLFSLGAVLLLLRITAPETLVAGVLPSPETLGAVAEEMDLAFRTVRRGVPPVIAGPGLIAVLAVVTWSIGALYTWGSTDGPVAALSWPSLAMYLQFAVFDRLEGGRGWLAAASIAVALAVASLAMERGDDTGRARDSEGRPVARRSIGVTAATAVVLAVASMGVADAASSVFSEFGNAPWRTGGAGYGSGEGGISFNRLVSLRQRVISRSNRPVFVATLGPGAPPAGEVYWRVETLDEFDGTEWDRFDYSVSQYQPARPLANEYDVYQGTVSDFYQIVRIENLVTDVAPTAGVPIEIAQPSGDGGRIPAEFQVLNDSAVVAQGGLSEGDRYQVRTLLADRSADLGALATGEDGQLTPMFAAAAAAGAFPHEPRMVAEPPVAPPDLGRYIDLPENIPTAILSLARSITGRASSDFERAWMLQAWFRDGDRFDYSTEVDTGHSSLDLVDWLTDRTSVNYRRGYCEQFAAAMAVLLRSVGVPSRVVWGFTPGQVEIQPDGTELVVVRDTNAHAWVEAWIDPVGWVQFDPTPRAEETGFEAQPASFTAALNPERFLPEPTPSEVQDEPQFNEDRFGEDPVFNDPGTPLVGTGFRVSWIVLVVLALAALVAAVPVVKSLRRRRRLGLIRSGDVTAAWDEIVDRLTDLGEPPAPHLTPIEVARTTDRSLLPLALRYSAALYGGLEDQASEQDLRGVEWWIERTYDGTRRARAAMSLKSLLPRR